MPRLTPQQRSDVHKAAVSAKHSGYMHGCHYKVMPRINTPVEHDEDKMLTISTMNTMMFENREFAKLSLHIYKMLYYKISSQYSSYEVQVFIKGSSALAMHFASLDNDMSEVFPFSDIDISVMVNPNLPEDRYNAIYDHIKMIVGQVFAKHKQYMDRIFFKLNRSDTVSPPSFDITEFMDRHISTCETVDMVSPFVNDEIRNACSYNSFTITSHINDEEKVVKVNEAHFNKAEFIPFDCTPIFCSMNESLDDFVLYRMKWNLINSDGKYMSVDFIDCIIPKKSSIELQNFTNDGGFDGYGIEVIQQFGTYISVPTLDYLAKELWRCIYEYTCPESKMEIRKKKYNILMNYLKG